MSAISAISATSAPHSNEAEQMVLGKLINYPELFEEVYSIVPEPNMFYIDAHRILWDIMIMMYGIKEDINYVTIVNNIPKKYEKDLDAYYITGLIDAVPGKTGVESYAKIVYDKWLLRNAIEDAYKITKAGQLSDADGYKMIENINASTSKIMSMRHNEKFDMNELLEDIRC